MSRLNNSICPIRDPQVIRVLERMNNERKHPPQELFREAPALDPEKIFQLWLFHSPRTGGTYLLTVPGNESHSRCGLCNFCRYVSALFCRCDERGLVIGSEMVREKAEVASRNLAEAGLTSFVDIRVGDARETLKDLGGPVDFILIDGFPLADGPSLARKVTEIVAPQLRVGGYILNDNAEPDFLSYIRDPQNGFISITLPIKRGTELALKIS